ncbi:hypothetical protein GCM10027610_081890 [Dactylosporangium cerinum]
MVFGYVAVSALDRPPGIAVVRPANFVDNRCMGVRGFLAQLAGLTATVALFWILHEQFEGRSAARPALVLGGALLAWWLLRSAFTGVEWRVRLGRLATGLILSGGAVYYGRAPLRFDVVLLALAVAMLAARALWYGKVPWRALIALWLVLAVAGRYVGQALALVVFWVPDRLIGLVDGGLGVLVGVVVWPLWAAVLAFTLGVYQTYTLVRERTPTACRPRGDTARPRTPTPRRTGRSEWCRAHHRRPTSAR